MKNKLILVGYIQDILRDNEILNEMNVDMSYLLFRSALNLKKSDENINFGQHL